LLRACRYTWAAEEFGSDYIFIDELEAMKKIFMSGNCDAGEGEEDADEDANDFWAEFDNQGEEEGEKRINSITLSSLLTLISLM
jgi:hypothetical protein